MRFTWALARVRVKSKREEAKRWEGHGALLQRGTVSSLHGRAKLPFDYGSSSAMPTNGGRLRASNAEMRAYGFSQAQDRDHLSHVVNEEKPDGFLDLSEVIQ